MLLFCLANSGGVCGGGGREESQEEEGDQQMIVETQVVALTISHDPSPPHPS